MANELLKLESKLVHIRMTAQADPPNTKLFHLADEALKELDVIKKTGLPREDYTTPELQSLTDVTALTFNGLRKANVLRCEEVFFPLNSWSPTDWGCALAGEAGEACNFAKKLKRGEDIAHIQIGFELADVVIYADLFAARLGLDLDRLVRDKFNFTSTKRNSNITL